MMIYADNAATTKMSQTAVAAMMPYLTEIYGNPSSLYAHGQKAKEALEKATATETETETEEASSETLSTEQITGATVAPATQQTTQTEADPAEKSSAENMSQESAAPGGSVGTGRFMNGVSILLAILAGILLFLCILVL